MTHKQRRQTRSLVRAFGEVQRAQARLRRIEQCPSTTSQGTVRCELTVGHIGQQLHRRRVLGTNVVLTW